MGPKADELLLDEDKNEPETWPKLVAPQADDWKFRISYFNVALFIYFHLSAIYGLYLCFTSAHWFTIVFAIFMAEAGMLGLMAGAHRLWSHRSYKAKLPLQIILMIFQSIASQYTVLNWVRDHRLHHRFSDTDGDPQNPTRGFFFAHIGWLLVQKHPEVRRRGGSINMSDLLSNPVLVFQVKYKIPFIGLVAYILPTICPMYFWGETLNNAWHINLLRFVICLNSTSLINSFGHSFGNRPYDKEVRATENTIANLATLGEGFHNYHHVFPRDYRSAEFGSKFNLTAAFIEFFSLIGWAYDLKTVKHDIIVRRCKKSGDGSYVEPKQTKT